MITLTKENGTKIINDSSSLLPILLVQGWVKKDLPDIKVETKKKDIKNGISSTPSN